MRCVQLNALLACILAQTLTRVELSRFFFSLVFPFSIRTQCLTQNNCLLYCGVNRRRAVKTKQTDRFIIIAARTNLMYTNCTEGERSVASKQERIKTEMSERERSSGSDSVSVSGDTTKFIWKVDNEHKNNEEIQNAHCVSPVFRLLQRVHCSPLRMCIWLLTGFTMFVRNLRETFFLCSFSVILQ